MTKQRAFHNQVSACCTFIVLALLPSVCAAVELEKVIWGFDGRPIEQQFIPVSMLVSNNSATAINANVILKQRLPNLQRTGAELQQLLYLSAGESRWIQFTPFIVGSYTNWVLEIGGKEFTLDRVQNNSQTPPAYSDPIQLFNPNTLNAKRGFLKRFPEELFPNSVAATSTLKVLFLDHVPRWETGRRRALLDWLYAGGELHILREDEELFPQFMEPLEELNTPLDEFHVGAGTVYRHPMQANQVTQEFVESLESLQRGKLAASNADAQVDYNDYSSYQYKSQAILRRLKRLIQTEHVWWLIYTIAVIYIGVNFPGLFLLSRRKVRFQTLYGIMLGSILLFSVIYFFIGRRGYDESSQVHSVAIVKPTSKEAVLANGWVNAFVTDGDNYDFHFNSPTTLFSTAQNEESVNGFVFDGHFVVDIPPFSSRSFTYQTKVPYKPFDIELLKWQPQGDNFAIQLKLDDRLAADKDDFARYSLVHKNRVYNMKRSGNVLSVRRKRFRPIEGFVAQNQDDYNQYAFSYQNEYNKQLSKEKNLEASMAKLLPTLLAEELRIVSNLDAKTHEVLDDRVKLLAFVKMPPELFVQEQQLNRQSGYMLYVSDVILPESP